MRFSGVCTSCLTVTMSFLLLRKKVTGRLETESKCESSDDVYKRKGLACYILRLTYESACKCMASNYGLMHLCMTHGPAWTVL